VTNSYLPGPEGEKPLVAYPKRRRTWPWIVAAVFVALLCGFGGLALISDPSAPKPVVTLPSINSQPTGTIKPSAAKAKTSAVTVGEGVWQVGVDVQPGRYRLAVSPSKDDNCYWLISRDDAGEDIVSNGLPTGGHPQVTLKKGQYFTTQDCGSWTLLK
jgi:hypothetical protein